MQVFASFSCLTDEIFRPTIYEAFLHSQQTCVSFEIFACNFDNEEEDVAQGGFRKHGSVKIGLEFLLAFSPCSSADAQSTVVTFRWLSV